MNAILEKKKARDRVRLLAREASQTCERMNLSASTTRALAELWCAIVHRRFDPLYSEHIKNLEMWIASELIDEWGPGSHVKFDYATKSVNISNKDGRTKTLKET